ncbi:tetratricopeptide repeat-containing sensor histidine kinase [Tenacibaculum sp. MEBiC07804]
MIKNQKDYELAKIYFDEGKFDRVLRKILPLAERHFEDKSLELKVNLLAGMVLERIGDRTQVYHLDISSKFNINNTRGIDFLKKAVQLSKELNLKNNEFNSSIDNYDVYLAQAYLSMSSIYLYRNQTDSVKIQLNKLLNIQSLNSEVEKSKGVAFINLGKAYYMENNLDKAENMFSKAVNFNKTINNDVHVALALNNLASLYVIKEEFLKSKKYYEEALTYIGNKKTLTATAHKEMIFDNLAWALYNLKDYKAYKYATDSYGIRDSLKEIGNQMKYAEIQAVHDVKSARQEEQLKTEQQERKTWIIGVAGIVVSLLLLYLANLYKLRQRSLSLKLSQSELEQQRDLERLKSQSQVKILNATIDGKETERKQIAEILHDNVSALLSSANMHLQASQKQFKDTAVPIELAKTQEIIAEASQKIRDLSHNLMSSVLLKFGLEYAVKDVAKKFSNSSIRINTAIHNVYRYSQDYEIKIFNIIQELINNILKHSQAKNAYIIMEEEDDSLNIIVKDDGVGFRNKSEEEKGVGINQIKARIHMMNGSFLIESSKGMGTKAIINIPVVRGNSRVYSA